MPKDSNAASRELSLDEQLASECDYLIRDQRYKSRSEAVWDLVRKAVEERRLNVAKTGRCVASPSDVYDHDVRSLAQRLVDMQHDEHDFVVSTIHVHLDHASCLEPSIPKGPIADVRALSDAIKAERNVRFAAINLISVDFGGGHRREQADHHHPTNGHSTPHRG